MKEHAPHTLSSCHRVRMPKPLHTAALLLALVLASAVLADAAVSKHVRLVQVLYRHGARVAVPAYNRSLICTDGPCGYLTTEGATMMQNLGAFLRDRYNADEAVVDEPMFPSKSYDVNAVYGRSTDVLRTLQSAEAFLRGFFPNASALAPAIHTQVEKYDTLLNSETVPWLHYYYTYNKPLLQKVGNVPTDELFPDWTELTRIGATIHSEGICSDYDTRAECAFSLFDICVTKNPSGLLGLYPLLEANIEKFKSIVRFVYYAQYHYNKSDDLDVKQGGRAQPFVQELVRNFDSAMSGSITYKLMHYSSHETMLAPVWATLGDRTENGMLPPFAQALVAELLQDAGDGSYHVRMLRGHPGQSPDTKFVFGWDDTWQFRCVDAAGTLYEATNNTCPIADFQRLQKWSAPADALGLCYLDEEFVRIRNCTDETVSVGGTGPTLSPPCIYYREHCPQFACTEGCVLDTISLQCVCRGFLGDGGASADTAKRGLADGAVAGIAVATFCVGAIIAVAVTVVACIYRQRRRRMAEDLSTSGAKHRGGAGGYPE